MADTTTGLIFRALLNEQSGTAIIDSSGLHANGTLNGTLATVPSPQPGRTAIQFNGTTNYISFADAADLDLAGSFTISYWAKVTNGAFAASSAYIVAKFPVADFANGYSMVITNGAMGTVLFPIGSNYQPGTPDWNNGNWRHIAHVVAYSGGQATTTHYIDGASVSSIGPITWTPAANAGPLIIGDAKAVAVGRYTGALSDVRIYTRALAADDIKSLTYTVQADSNLGINIGISI
jgi:hypothetical protein